MPVAIRPMPSAIAAGFDAGGDRRADAQAERRADTGFDVEADYRAEAQADPRANAKHNNDVAHKTDDPGWVIKGGDLLGGEVLWFRALGSLRFWDKNQQRWLDEPPNGERVLQSSDVGSSVSTCSNPQTQSSKFSTSLHVAWVRASSASGAG